jgi:hypothetical protein
MERNFTLSDFAFYFILISGLYLIYGHLFESDLFIAYDDSLISNGLEHITSLNQYIDHIRKGLIPDIQPVRDLFTWINYRLIRLNGSGHFHLTNVLVFVFLLMGIRKGLRLMFDRSKPLIDGLVLLIAFSPLHVSSVAWISARKHLLSGAFTVWASVALIRFIQGSRIQWIAFTIFYLLAVFSQPINLLWPCFALVANHLYGNRKDYPFLIPSMAITLIVGYLNLRYYETTYLWVSGGYSKYSNTEESKWGASYLAYCRYLFQSLVPYWTSVGEYDFRSWQNIAGAILIAPYYYVITKLTDLRKSILIFIAFMLALLPVIWKMTQRFGTDNYLVTASIPILIGVLLILRHSRIKPVIISAILIAGIGAEFQHSKSKAAVWTDTFSIFEQAYQVEPGFMNQFQYTDWLLNRGNIDTAYPLAVDLYQRHSDKLGASNLLARAITMTQLPVEKKIELFVQFKFYSKSSRLLLAQLELSRNNPAKAYEIVESVFSGTNSVNGVGFRCSSIAELWKKSCVRLKRKDCDQLDQRVAVKCNENNNL